MPPLATLLDRWANEPGQPRLTWYGRAGERVELTGRVLHTWVAKAANLLADEADAQLGTDVQLDLPAHWRAAVWALATWACGATVVLGEDAPDVLVTHRSVAPVGSTVVIVIALPALAMSADDVPSGAVDGAAEAMSQPDALIQPVSSVGATLRWDDQEDDLLATDIAGDRVLVQVDATDEANDALAALLRRMVGTWANGGSVVLVADPDADVDRIATQESARLIG
ncbi:TIGR03089 family protein [Ruania alba]|uniref:TIGR03089 family protein n=1 Tax=Ruania alba TaxID=648782 RepID=A0A1H5NCK1_9MICO|nr:TIGR03089 family protein [Ruania alba]SEE98388.1 TIGR03089 family protein [Ruania alba]